MKTLLSLFLLTLFVSLCGCKGNENSPPRNAQPPAPQWMQSNGKLKVLSTIAMIDDLVKQIGGEYVDTTVLIKGELDPHSYQLVKGDDEKLAFAQVIFYNGLGLEHGPSLQSYLQRQPKAIPLGNRIQIQDPKLVLYYKGQLDPHIWMDVSLWARTIPFIVNQLSQNDPAHSSIFHANGQKLEENLMKLHEDIKNQLQSLPENKRYLVTSHDAFNYFTRAYLAEFGEDVDSWSDRFAAPEGLAPESQISATDIQAIIDHLKKYNIHIIFAESNVSRDSIRKIVQAAKEKGLNVSIANGYLYADAMGAPNSDGDTYSKMMEHNAHAIAENLKNNAE